MSRFLVGHATHPDWRRALALAAAQIEARRSAPEHSEAGPLTLGLVYFSDHYAAQAAELLAALRGQWPGVAWAGSVGVGVAAAGVEYIDEPALVLMLAALPPGRFKVFSGASKLSQIEPYSALVHADPSTPDLAELIGEMSDRTTSGYLFGGLASSRGPAWQVADGLWRGGLSGVAFSRDVALISRVSQGSQPLGPTRRITACERNLVLELDGQPALPCLMADLGLENLDEPREALPRLRATLVGLGDPPLDADADAALEIDPPAMRSSSPARNSSARRGHHRAFGEDVRVRHLVGLDPGRQAVAVADVLEPGMTLAFCQRDVAAARRDLVRICSEIREELEPAAELALHPAAHGAGTAHAPAKARRILGALYVSCAGRGGAHFGGPSAELQIVQHALGGDEDLPLVGFFAAGEIGHHHLYGYTGVLTVFTGQA
jgi:small ligand-binding sensory domain FIST